MRRLDAWDGIAGLAFLLLAAFLVLPLGKLLWASVVADGGGLTLRHYAAFLGRPYYSRTIGHSFVVASLVTLASMLLALPLAWITARVAIPGALLLRTLAILPLVSPPFIGAYSWILLFGRAGYVTATLRGWGLTVPTVYGMHGIVLALTLNLYPLAFLVILSQLRPSPPVRLRPAMRGLLTALAYGIIGLSLIPAAVVAVTSFFEARGPVLYPRFSVGNYREIFFNVPGALVNSLTLSGVSTAVDVLLGTLIAYLVVRRRSPVTAGLDSAVMLPYAIPGTVVGIAYIVAFNAPPLVLTGTFVILA